MKIEKETKEIWLDLACIIVAAEKSDTAALASTRAHWKQIAAVSLAEFKNAVDLQKVNMFSSFCALCIRFHRTRLVCPLRGTRCFGSCIKAWKLVRDAYVSNNKRRWKESVAAMIEILEQIEL